MKDTIKPIVTCPNSRTVTMLDYTMTITLEAAYATDNVGIRSLEYLPVIADNSAVFKAPDTLTLTEESVGKNYTVLVITRDVDDNEARCKYFISVTGEFRKPEEFWERFHS